VAGIDGPCSCAPDGETSRAGERALARAVCGIRWTPDREHVRGGGYYGWVVEGLRLYAALDRAAIEVFPTASWTRWVGARGTRSRADWSRAGLGALGLAGVPARTNQDQRDAIAAAVTARSHSRGETEAFGEIVVPTSPVRAALTRSRRTRRGSSGSGSSSSVTTGSRRQSDARP
jgi:predicted nuclease with RNAse H fold